MKKFKGMLLLSATFMTIGLKAQTSGSGLCSITTNERLVEQIAQETLGAQGSCYMQLFLRETDAQPTCYQAAGNANNPYAAYGLCSLYASQAQLIEGAKALQGGDYAAAGNPCSGDMNGATDAGIANQMRCCRYYMVNDPAYFNDPAKPVRCY